MYFERFGQAIRKNISRLSLRKNGKVSRPLNQRFGTSHTEDDDVAYYRRVLEEKGKFPVFTHVLIETRTDCNRRCSFCPQSQSQRPFKEMAWSVFEKIIQDLARINFSGRIAFYMTNEPLLDSRLENMIRYARNASAKFFLDTNSNGNLLNIDLMDRLIKAGLDNINIDDYRSDRDIYPDKLSPNIQAIRDAYGLNPKIQVDLRRTNEVLSNRAGNVKKKQDNPYLNSFCNYPFRKLAISPYGDVVLCCYDYHYTSKLGNVMDRDLIDLWHSEAMDNYRYSLLDKNRVGICSNCDAYQYGKVPSDKFQIVSS